MKQSNLSVRIREVQKEGGIRAACNLSANILGGGHQLLARTGWVAGVLGVSLRRSSRGHTSRKVCTATPIL